MITRDSGRNHGNSFSYFTSRKDSTGSKGEPYENGKQHVRGRKSNSISPSPLQDMQKALRPEKDKIKASKNQGKYSEKNNKDEKSQFGAGSC